LLDEQIRQISQFYLITSVDLGLDYFTDDGVDILRNDWIGFYILLICFIVFN